MTSRFPNCGAVRREHGSSE